MNRRKVTITELKALVEDRLDEAEILFKSKKYNGSFYLAGYCIELSLKARICSILDLEEYPEHLNGYKTHDFETLIQLAGLKRRLEDKLRSDDDFLTNWLEAKKWNESLRYNALELTDQELTTNVLANLRSEDGILNWIKETW